MARQGGGPARKALWLAAALWVTAPAVAWATHQAMGLALAPLHWTGWAWALLGAPLLEEWVFRPLLQQGLHIHWSPRLGFIRAGWWAAAAASAVFALAHAPAHGWAALWWLVPGTALAVLWQQGARLALCAATHAWFNACLAIATVIATAGGTAR